MNESMESPCQSMENECHVSYIMENEGIIKKKALWKMSALSRKTNEYGWNMRVYGKMNKGSQFDRRIYVPGRAFATHPAEDVQEVRLHRLQLGQRQSPTSSPQTRRPEIIPATMGQSDLPPNHPDDIFFISVPLTTTTGWRLPAYDEVLEETQILCSVCNANSNVVESENGCGVCVYRGFVNLFRCFLASLNVGLSVRMSVSKVKSWELGF